MSPGGKAVETLASPSDKEIVSGQGQEKAFAIIGLERLGESLALALAQHECRLLGIDRDAVVVQRLSAQFPCIALDATDEDALREADVGDFDTAVVAIGSDFESNVLATVALKNVGVERIICLSASEYESEILLRVGADRVIEPGVDGGRRLAKDLVASHAQETLPVGPEHVVGKVVVPEGAGGQRLDDLGLSRHQVQVLAVQRGELSLVRLPADTVLNEGDMLVVLGAVEVIGRVAQLWDRSVNKDEKP